MKSRLLAIVTAVLLTLGVSPAWADETPALRIQVVDSVAPGARYITLFGYTNPACEGNRILLLENGQPQYFKEMQAIVLSAFMTETPVMFDYVVSSGQCLGNRVKAIRN